MMSSFAQCIGVFAAALTVSASAMAGSLPAPPIVVSGNGISISPSSSSYGWDRTQHAALRAELENPANFGPGGTVESPGFQTVDLPAISAQTLANVDIFVSSWWLESQSAVYHQFIVDWFKDGGSLVLFQDRNNRGGISKLLGFETINGTRNPNAVSGLLGDGPFGTVDPVNQFGDVGHFDNTVIQNLGGEILSVNANDQATIVMFDAGVLAPNSGKLFAFGDVDFISSSGGARFGADLNDKGQLALNLFAQLAGSSQPAPNIVPSPAAVGVGFIGMLVVCSRRRAKSL